MFPLSKQQELVWLHEQIAPGSRAYYFTAVVDLRGTLDVGFLRDALVEAVGHHDAMRLRLCDGPDTMPVQEVAPDVAVEIPEHDLRHVPDREERRLDAVRVHAAREFDLGTAPLARWVLLRLADDHWQLVHAEHHLIHDGRSFGGFLDDVFSRYAARLDGTTYQPPVAPTYEEYVAFTRSPEYVADASRAVDWWVDTLKGATYGIDFPGLGSKRADRRDFTGAQYRQKLPAELMAAVTSTARGGGYTVFPALLAAFAETCRRHSGQEDLVIGTALPNRPPRFEHTVGMLVNSVPLRMPAAPGASGHQSAWAAMASVYDAMDHQSAPVQDMVRALGLSSADLDNQLFNVMFSMHDRPLPTTGPSGLAVEVHGGLNERSARFDIDVVVLPPDAVYGGAGRQEYTVVWDYSTQRFSEDDIRTLAARFACLLRNYASDPDQPLGSLEGVDAATSPTTSGPGPLPPLEPLVAELPTDSSAAAVLHGAEALTYQDLDERVEARIRQLHRAGLGEGDVLALRIPRGVEAIVYLLACLRSGIVFAPLSTALPRNLLNTVLDRLRPAAVVTQPEDIVDLADTDRMVCDISQPDRVLRPGGEGVPRPGAAYVIHTSGSTGVPKAVAVPSDSLSRIVAAVTGRYRLDGDDHVLQFADPAFDVFIEEVLPTLRVGASLVIPRHEAPTGEELAALMLARGISVLNIPTSYALSVADALDALLAGRDQRLRLLVVGGERLSAADMGRLAGLPGGPRVLNAYGVTEAVITSTCFAWGEDATPDGSGPDGAGVPIGRPLDGVDVCVVDTRGIALPHGMVGNIAIAVPGGAARYVEDPEANEHRFTRLPSRSDRLYYLTGDRGFQDGDGMFHFLGRLDRQVKVNGHRIELEEIELAVKTVRPGSDCAVTVMPAGGADILVGFVAGGQDDAADGLERALAALLPRYAVPRRWVSVPLIPRHAATGKVDFTALTVPPEPAEGPPLATAAAEFPWLRAFREVLGRDDITPDSDFFRMGGHSLLVFRLLSRYEELTGWRPPTSLVFEYPSPGGLQAETARLREAAAVESGPDEHP
ncbi:condensation domain-containing protein [Streptomyces sp. JJ38]|uniref:non-ribosomal peptide synthetase n=1 Tax=Streptomyces sp. JJ38 TaxID=2738128 RepID=UPI001C562EC7|nr:condensation domain-containing protein [Streptomyces sp. JJ38]MBW1598381.1 AMP-binding protein [Streptomyces sp. JJ38]